jgi:acetyltransferase
LVSTSAQAATAAASIGFPVALKIQSADIAHKTEAGGVALDVGAGQVEAAFTRVLASATRHAPRASIEGVLVQKMMPRGHEFVVGMTRDKEFGPMVMLGSGGIYLEVIRDVLFAPPPISRIEALRLIDRLRAAPILKGVRGQQPGDIDALADLVTHVGELALQEVGIDQLDLNPVLVFQRGAGVVAVDALVVVGQGLRLVRS